MRQPIEIMTRVMDNLSESSKNSFCVVSDRLSEGNRAIFSTYYYPTKYVRVPTYLYSEKLMLLKIRPVYGQPSDITLLQRVPLVGKS